MNSKTNLAQNEVADNFGNTNVATNDAKFEVAAPNFMAKIGATLVDRGYPILPIQPRTKKPGMYRSGAWCDYPKWSRHCTRATTENEVDIWGDWPEAGIGIAAGQLIGVDIDIQAEGEIALEVESLAKRMLGNTPAVRIGKAPKRLLVYRAAQAFVGFKYPPIEILGEGQQFVAYGIHPETNKPYEWPVSTLADLDLGELPAITQAQAREFAKAAYELIPAELKPKTVSLGNIALEASNEAFVSLSEQRGTLDAVGDALKFIANDDLDYDSWVRVGMAIKGALGEQGKDVFEQWSATSQKFVGATTAQAWQSFKPTRIGAGTIYKLALDHGWSPAAEVQLNGEIVDDSVHPAQALIDSLHAASLRSDVEARPTNLAAFMAPTPEETSSDRIEDWHAIDRFQGQPKARRWLVNGIFPMAQASLLASGGGVGKSFSLLALSRGVADYDGNVLDAPMHFGGSLVESGAAVYITAEDDAIELHNRLHSLGAIPPRLYTVPLPDAGGAQAYFAPNPLTKTPGTTGAWDALKEQIASLGDVKLIVIDPLQPLCALDLNVPENAQFVCSRLAEMAAQTQAAVIVSHHFAKREATTPEQAREAIRGSGGLVDGVRCVYALWQPREERSRAALKQLQLPYQRAAVVHGGVVKANGNANLSVVTFVRNANGLLCDRSRELLSDKAKAEELLRLLKNAIQKAAAQGQPYTKTGVSGLFARKSELVPALHGVSKHKFTFMVDELLVRELVVQAMAKGSLTMKWLDVPDGPFAKGEAEFRHGHLARGDDEDQENGSQEVDS